MINSIVKKAPLLSATVCGLLFGMASLANANTVTMQNYNGSAGGTATCTASCLGFEGGATGLISLSETSADEFPQGTNPESEKNILNELLSRMDSARAPVVYFGEGGQAGNGFSTNRQYFAIKKANELWFFENTSGGSVSVAISGEAYSHWTEFGTEVPIPAAAWLFGSGLIGLAGIARKRKAS